MTFYSVQPRDQIFVKGYGFLSFARNMGKNISKDLSSKNSKKLLDETKEFPTDALKTLKIAIQKTAGVNGDLIEKKMLIKLQELQSIYCRIIQKQMNKKYLEKDLYL